MLGSHERLVREASSRGVRLKRFPRSRPRSLGVRLRNGPHSSFDCVRAGICKPLLGRYRLDCVAYTGISVPAGGNIQMLGVYTTASALVFLALNSFFSAATSVPVFLIARKSMNLQTATLAAWVWAFFPYSIYFSAATMWYHSFVALLLRHCFS